MKQSYYTADKTRHYSHKHRLPYDIQYNSPAHDLHMTIIPCMTFTQDTVKIKEWLHNNIRNIGCCQKVNRNASMWIINCHYRELNAFCYIIHHLLTINILRLTVMLYKITLWIVLEHS